MSLNDREITWVSNESWSIVYDASLIFCKSASDIDMKFNSLFTPLNKSDMVLYLFYVSLNQW